MIHYHGLPITPAHAAAKILAGRHALISWAYPQQIEIAAEACSSFILDNGAFTRWRQGETGGTWDKFYEWVAEWKNHPTCDFALIPDVIGGSSSDNDALISEWSFDYFGVPVWHLHEPLSRLNRLSFEWPCVALGSSGKYHRPGTDLWWHRIDSAMKVACDDGKPRCKLHGLRMLAPSVFTRVPLHSADSCNVGRNIGIDKHWTGSYRPPDKAWRGIVLAARIESHQSASVWNGLGFRKETGR